MLSHSPPLFGRPRLARRLLTVHLYGFLAESFHYANRGGRHLVPGPNHLPLRRSGAEPGRATCSPFPGGLRRFGPPDFAFGVNPQSLRDRRNPPSPVPPPSAPHPQSSPVSRCSIGQSPVPLVGLDPLELISVFVSDL